MAMELCLEAAGGLVHALDLAWGARRLPRPIHVRALARGQSPPTVPGVDLADGPSMNVMVHRSVDRLPFENAEALWLVDVCGLDYADAAVEIGVDRKDVAGLVASARSTVRADLIRSLPPF